MLNKKYEKELEEHFGDFVENRISGFYSNMIKSENHKETMERLQEVTSELEKHLELPEDKEKLREIKEICFSLSTLEVHLAYKIGLIDAFSLKNSL